jgi:hypothetical protein
MPLAPDDYAVVARPPVWLIHKFSGHHGYFLTTYQVKIIEIDGKTEFRCNCMATIGCKHILMVLQHLKGNIENKKDLFS